MEHKKWKSIYLERPHNGSKCVTSISGEEGYNGNTIYHEQSATFRTIEDKHNRLVITIWKCNQWYYT